MIRETDLNVLYRKVRLKLSEKDTVVSEPLIAIPNSYVVKLTTECNLKCQYCYMGTSSYIPSRLSENIFELILEQIKGVTKKFTIYLHGGEPCLCIELIKYLKSWIDKNRLNNSITIMLQTNGTIMNQELIELIQSMKINVGISLDGISNQSNCARISKENQPITEIVLKNIEALLSKNISVGIFSVLTSFNSSEILTMIDYFANIGIKNFVINPLVLWGNARGMNKYMATETQVFEAYKEIIDWLGDYNSIHDSNEQITERNLHWWFRGLTDGSKGYMCNCSPCGAGIHTVAISPQGDVYVCDQYYGDNRFLIGNIINSTLRSIIESAQSAIKGLRNIYDIDACKHCVWRYVCCGGCSASSFYYYGNMRSIAPYCEAYKRIFSYIETKLQSGELAL